MYDQCSLYVTGLSAHDIGRLGCSESIDLTIDVVALHPGLQYLNKCTVTDRLTGTSYTIDDGICAVFVDDSDDLTLLEME